jgi:septal ring factor EnvC (AmiA/AmiB activator)
MSDVRSCPRCGSYRPLGEFGICVPCAAAQGWDPECAACLAEQEGRKHQWRHESTCGPGIEQRAPTSARLRQVQADLAASQQDLTHVEGQLRDAEQDRMRAERERDEALHELAHLRFQLDMVRTRLGALAADNRADARRPAVLGTPSAWGPNRAAEAYEKAAALIETLGGES